MANLEELAAEVRDDGYSEVNAEAKVCLPPGQFGLLHGLQQLFVDS